MNKIWLKEISHDPVCISSDLMWDHNPKVENL